MENIFLAKEDLIEALHKICREENTLQKQVWFDESIESELKEQYIYGSSNVPYIGVEMRAFKTSSDETLELYYKTEGCRMNPGCFPAEIQNLYLLQFAKLNEKFCFFGAAPEEVIIIKGK